MKKIGKVLIVVVVFFLATGMLMAGGARGRADTGVVELAWGCIQAGGHPWVQVSNLIVREVYERSGGTIRITYYNAAVLGSEHEMVGMLRDGSLALLTSGPSILASFYEAVQVPGLPFIFDNPAHARRFFNSAYSQRVYNEIILGRSGIRTIDFWYLGDRHLTTRGLQVNSPADLSGVRIRSMDTPVSRTTVDALGANAVPISFPELYFALQTGVVVGQENPIPSIISQRFYEVQDNVILTGHSVHMGTVHVSEQIWSRLTAEQQRIILDAFDKYRDEVDRLVNQQTEEGIRTLRARGVQVYAPTDIEAFRAHAARVVDENFGHLPGWGEGIRQARAHR